MYNNYCEHHQHIKVDKVFKHMPCDGETVTVRRLLLPPDGSTVVSIHHQQGSDCVGVA